MKLKQQILSAVMLAASTGAQAAQNNSDNLQGDYSVHGDHFASGTFMDRINSGRTSRDRGDIATGSYLFTAGGKPFLDTGGRHLSLFDRDDGNIDSSPDTFISMSGGDHAGGIKGRSLSIFESDTERGARNFATGKHHSDWREWAYHYQTRTRCVSPVPEPGVWNFLVVGLAMIGFIAYRRRDMH